MVNTMNEIKRHVYAKHIEKKNLHGYMVNHTVPFLKLFDAEEYCMQQNVPPDKDHLTFDPKNARLCAIGLIPELERLRDLLEVQLAEVQEKTRVYAAKRDKFKALHSVMGNVEAETTQEEIQRLIGQSDALTGNLLKLQNRLYELFLLSRLTDSEQPK